MPQVPRVTANRVQVAPLPSVRQTAVETPQSLGAGVADTVERIGLEQFGRLHEEARRRADETALLGADRQLADFELARLHDPTKGAFATVKGKDAAGLLDTVPQEYDDLASKIETGLNASQRDAFARLKHQRRAGLMQSVTSYADREVQQYHDTEAKAALATSVQTAVANFDNPERLAQEIQRQGLIADGMASQNGLGPEARAALKAESVSRTHLGVLDRMLAQGNDITAATYYAANKDQIAGDDRAKVERVLETASTEGAALRASNDLWTAGGPKSDGDPVQLDQLEDAARARFADDPKTLKATLLYLRERASAFNAAQHERRDANESAVWQAVANGGTLATVTRMREFNDLPGGKQLDVKEHIRAQAEHAESFLRQRRREARADAREAKADAADDPKAWAAYWDHNDAATLSKMSRDQIFNLLPKFGGNVDFVNRLLKNKQDYAENAEKVRSATLDDATFNSIAEAAGLDPFAAGKDKTEEDKARLGRLKSAWLDEIGRRQTGGGKVLDLEQKKAIGQELIDRSVMVESRGGGLLGGLFGSSSPRVAAVVNKGEAPKAYVPLGKIPTVNVDEAVNVIRANDPSAQRLTPDAIRTRYAHRIERAYAALVLGLGDSEILQRLRED